MKKILRNTKFIDFIFIASLIVFYFIVISIITNNGKYFIASEMDFGIQHYSIPDLFRKIFYETHNLFPNFTFNLGGGINIYCLSYYGLFSPMVFLSLFFPHIDMLTFTILFMNLVIISSIILLYFYFRKNKYTSLTSFLCTFVFLCATPIIFHTHRHIMFVNYLPFLILGLYGIDNFIEKKKSFLLIISTTLIILSSYYFSISCICVLYIFAIFKYIKNNNFIFKDLFKFIISFTLRIIIAILISSILIIPTFYTLVSGRESGSALGIGELFTKTDLFLEIPYSMGLTKIILYITIIMIFSKKIENRVLSILLLLVAYIPIFNYILNGFLYINGKVLIPFIILVVINIADFFEFIFRYKKYIINAFLVLLIIYTSSKMCIYRNKKDTLIEKSTLNNEFYKNYDQITKIDDSNTYRINSSNVDKYYINKVGNTTEYKTTLYSSALNKIYRDFYINLIKNPLNYRNKFMLTSSNNVLFQIIMGEKYIFSKDSYNSIYEKEKNYDDVFLYRNDYVMPIIYATNKVINKEEFNKLKYPDTVINLIGNAVVNDNTNTIVKKVKKEKLIINKFSYDDLSYEKKEDEYFIDSEKNGSIKIEIDNNLKNKILFISFDIIENTSCKNKDLTITINGITNKLTCKEWKYYNDNTSFEYVLLPNTKELNISFVEGKYKIGNIEIYSLDFDEIKDINKKVDPFIFDKDKTIGDKIVGSISVSNDSYVVTSIPYDEGFSIYIDNKKVDYYLINNTFIGFNIKKGNHNIEIVYNAPYRNLSLVISGLGVISFISLVVFENKKKKSNKRT